MGEQVILAGQLTLAPACASGSTFGAGPTGVVPAGVSQVPLGTTPNPKQAAVSTGLKHKVLSSPSGFQTIRGLGAGDDVTTADFLYCKSDAPIVLQLTYQNPGGDPIVSTLPLLGAMTWEFPSGQLLTGLAAEGSANLEILITGPQ